MSTINLIFRLCLQKRLSVFVLVLLFFARPVAAFESATYFEKNCSSCHTIGAGDDVGPDLKGVADRRTKEWLIPFIQSSQTVIGKGDPVAVELFNKFKQKKMPDQDISAQEIEALLDYIKSGGSGNAPKESKPASSATPADVELGRRLFTGVNPLKNGAPSCISCHKAGDSGILGGGTFGLDLTQSYSKYEDKGLSKALMNPGFRVMKEVFADKPLTEDEAFALKAFLYEVDKQGSQSVGDDQQKKFIFLGIGGCALMLGVTDFVWRKRRRKSTKPWAKG